MTKEDNKSNPNIVKSYNRSKKILIKLSITFMRLNKLGCQYIEL